MHHLNALSSLDLVCDFQVKGKREREREDAGREEEYRNILYGKASFKYQNIMISVPSQ